MMNEGCTFEQAIENGKAKIAAKKAKLAEESFAKVRALQEKWDAWFSEVRMLVPEVVRSYLKPVFVESENQSLPVAYESLMLEAPECDPVRVDFLMAKKGWVLGQKPFCIFDDQRNDFDDVEEALAFARQKYEDRNKAADEIDEWEKDETGVVSVEDGFVKDMSIDDLVEWKVMDVLARVGVLND